MTTLTFAFLVAQSVQTVGTPLLWAGFAGLILVAMALDLGVFHRQAHEVGFREAAAWTTVWVSLAAGFGIWVGFAYGAEKGLQFATGYLIEWSLSVDNVLVFAVLFTAFAVPAVYQHRVLFWGVLGAVIMRAIFIGAGAAVLTRFHWVMYVFGAILVFSGIRLLRRQEEAVHPEHNVLFRLFRRVVPSVHAYHGAAFTVVEGGRRYATPLLTVLVAVEITDLVFAVDSIPAVFAVTLDPFIVFTSNIFAILGLRSLYFLLHGALKRLAYLHVGLALVLVFVGVKMLLMDVFKVPTPVSLAVITLLIGSSVAWSLYRTRGARLAAAAAAAATERGSSAT